MTSNHSGFMFSSGLISTRIFQGCFNIVEITYWRQCFYKWITSILTKARLINGVDFHFFPHFNHHRIIDQNAGRSYWSWSSVCALPFEKETILLGRSWFDLRVGTDSLSTSLSWSRAFIRFSLMVERRSALLRVDCRVDSRAFWMISSFERSNSARAICNEVW